jgi:Fe(II)/alpha-ketoglutarate-dependent arginine beta-hydroxylase
MRNLTLDAREADELASLLAHLRHRYSSADGSDFLLDAQVQARLLPARVHQFLSRFRREEPGIAIISGHVVDVESIGPTPAHWNQLPDPSPTIDFDLLLVLYAAILGDAFGWATQQDGRMAHDVLPIKENEGQQLGTAPDVLLDWHTEDAFHPFRPDWVILACIRNPTDTPTTIAVADELRLRDADFRVLSQPRFTIRPDNSHLARHNSEDSGADFQAVERMLHNPLPIPLLWGDPCRPYLRADPSFWGIADPADAEAAAALARFSEEIDRRLHDVVLRPGDFCFLDNYKVVHGRRPFPARYDGTDRWLKRVCVTRDLRKSWSARKDLISQVLG